jgi:hypothetical protein
MLIRISLIVAILAGLAVAVLNFVTVKEKITTTIEARDKFHTERDQEAKDKKIAQKLAKDTQVTLDKTKEQLVSTTKERDDAVAQAEDLTKKDQALTEKLKKTEQDRDSARDEVAAWKALGIPIENIKSTMASLKKVKDDRDAIALENKILSGKYQNLLAKYNDLINPEDQGPDLPAGLRGKVLVADPKYDFVVLNIGSNQGVLTAGRFLVNRNGKLVAKVKVQSVQADRCIANVMPGWKLSEVLEGDQVIY